MIYYVTGNESKFKTAVAYLEPLGIILEQKVLDVEEIQPDSIVKVSEDKVKKAFKIAHVPLFVNDSGWEIPALNGFPGPYMKYMNDWFSPDDFLRLMEGKPDRRIILKQVITYVDKNGTKVFENDTEGIVLEKVGDSPGRSSDRVISLGDGISMADQKAKGNYKFDGESDLWKEFSDWLKTLE